MDQVEIAKLKAALKAWEKDFKEAHGRMPDKADIKAVPSIAEKYKLYNKSRTSSTSSGSASNKVPTVDVKGKGREPPPATDILQTPKRTRTSSSSGRKNATKPENVVKQPNPFLPEPTQTNSTTTQPTSTPRKKPSPPKPNPDVVILPGPQSAEKGSSSTSRFEFAGSPTKLRNLISSHSSSSFKHSPSPRKSNPFAGRLGLGGEDTPRTKARKFLKGVGGGSGNGSGIGSSFNAIGGGGSILKTKSSLANSADVHSVDTISGLGPADTISGSRNYPAGVRSTNEGERMDFETSIGNGAVRAEDEEDEEDDEVLEPSPVKPSNLVFRPLFGGMTSDRDKIQHPQPKFSTSSSSSSAKTTDATVAAAPGAGLKQAKLPWTKVQPQPGSNGTGFVNGKKRPASGPAGAEGSNAEGNDEVDDGEVSASTSGPKKSAAQSKAKKPRLSKSAKAKGKSKLKDLLGEGHDDDEEGDAFIGQTRTIKVFNGLVEEEVTEMEVCFPTGDASGEVEKRWVKVESYKPWENGVGRGGRTRRERKRGSGEGQEGEGMDDGDDDDEFSSLEDEPWVFERRPGGEDDGESADIEDDDEDSRMDMDGAAIPRKTHPLADQEIIDPSIPSHLISLLSLQTSPIKKQRFREQKEKEMRVKKLLGEPSVRKKEFKEANRCGLVDLEDEVEGGEGEGKGEGDVGDEDERVVGGKGTKKKVGDWEASDDDWDSEVDGWKDLGDGRMERRDEGDKDGWDDM